MRQAGSWVNEFVAELSLLQPFQANEFTCGFHVLPGMCVLYQLHVLVSSVNWEGSAWWHQLCLIHVMVCCTCSMWVRVKPSWFHSNWAICSWSHPQGVVYADLDFSRQQAYGSKKSEKKKTEPIEAVVYSEVRLMTPQEKQQKQERGEGEVGRDGEEPHSPTIMWRTRPLIPSIIQLISNNYF